MDSRELFHILRCFFTGTGATVRLLQCQRKILTHCGLAVSYDDIDLSQHEIMYTVMSSCLVAPNHYLIQSCLYSFKWGLVSFTWRLFTEKSENIYPWCDFENYYFKIIAASSNGQWVNSFLPSDALWWHRSRSALVRAMACCLTAPRHYMRQCWLGIIAIHPTAISQNMHQICLQKLAYKNHSSTTFYFYQGKMRYTATLQWRNNERDGVSDHQPHDCLLNRLFRRRS